ncbi:hypothetical protein GBAR_LOCUS13917, partial [Geodia barretti]
TKKFPKRNSNCCDSTKQGIHSPTPVDSSSVPIYDTPSWDTTYCKPGHNLTTDHDCFMEENPVYLMATNTRDKEYSEAEEAHTSQHVYEAL